MIEKFFSEKVFKISLAISVVIWFMFFYKFTQSYSTDILTHIDYAIEGSGVNYSLNALIIQIIHFIGGKSMVVVIFPLFLSLMLLFTIYALHKFLMLILEIMQIDDCYYIYDLPMKWLSFFSIYFISVFIPYIAPVFYLGNVSMTCWHNDTFISMKPFSILALTYFLKIYDTINNHISINNVIKYSLTLTMSVLCKPSFFVAFVFLLIFLGVYNIYKYRNESCVLSRILYVVIATIPSGIIVLFQNLILFEGEFSNDNSVVFLPFIVIKHFEDRFDTSFILAYIVYLVFPCWTALLIKRAGKVKDLFWYGWIWMIWFIENLFYICFAESGDRMFHANFVWGTLFANNLLYVACFFIIYVLLKEKKYSLYIDKKSVGGGQTWNIWLRLTKAFSKTLLFWLFGTGVYYYVYVYINETYQF